MISIGLGEKVEMEVCVDQRDAGGDEGEQDKEARVRFGDPAVQRIPQRDEPAED